MLDRPAGTVTAVPVSRRGQRGLPPEDQLSIHAVLGMLRRRRHAFLVCALLIPLAALIAVKQMTPRYIATGALMYEPSEYKGRELQSVLQTDPTTEAVMASQAEILHSMHIAAGVSDQLHFISDPEFNQALRPPGLLHRALRHFGLGAEPPDDIIGPRVDDSRINTLLAVRAAFDANTVKYSRVIEVKFTSENPVLAAAAVNQAMDIYIKDQYRAKSKAVETATSWLSERARVLRKQVRDREQAVTDYRNRHGFSQGMHGGLEAEDISHLSEDLAHAQAEQANAEGRLDAARGRAGAEAQAAIAPSVVQLRAQLDQAEAQWQADQGRLGPNHPSALAEQREIVDLRRSVAAEIARVVSAINAEMRAARQRVDALRTDLEEARAREDRGAQAQLPLNDMQRELDASRQELQAVLDRIQQTAQQAAIEVPEAHEISEALPPTSPSWPPLRPALAAATAFGVFLGLLLVYLLELADTSLRSGEDARAALGLPCFALLPETPRRRHQAMSIDEYVTRKTLSPFAEQVRALRAGLWLGSSRPAVIAITSARAEEGKTTVALALGRSAALSGERVLLLECDLRHPVLAARLHVAAPVGLAEHLRNKADVAALIQRDTLSPLRVIQAGRIGTDSPDLFLSGTMARLLAELRHDYDLILLDAPPVQAMTEARIVAGIADATLLCTRWGATPRAVLLHVLELLEEAHAHVVGTVLTRVDARAHVRSGHADADVYHRRRKTYAE
ncbi:MAG TPA: polysaccharide biosynthesis tyrosine autokinase [Acetobacteraceae bacterium]|jgi:capsular exopolysaccharide synthesis family protein